MGRNECPLLRHRPATEFRCHVQTGPHDRAKINNNGKFVPPQLM